MKKHTILLLLILLVLGLVFYFSFIFTIKSVTNNLIEQQIETSRNQADLVSRLLETKLKNGYSKNEVLFELQKSIDNFPTENSFVCLFDNSGKEICHPEKGRIGKVLEDNNSIIQLGSNFEVEINFKNSIINGESTGGVRKMKSHTEIVYLSPVKNSDWIIASHTNIEKHKRIINNLKEKLLLTFSLIWLVSSLVIFFFLYLVNENNLKDLSVINNEISIKYFNEIRNIQNNQILPVEKPAKSYDRLLVDKGAKLAPVFINNLAYTYTQNRVTYLIEFNGGKSSTNLTLDELFEILDKDVFYRVSRQVILSVKSICEIEKYGNAQLKISVTPSSPIDIVVSKAKLSEFKKWAGKN